MRVAIIGGGIGGMSLALSLRAAGFEDVDVYESAPAVREITASLLAASWSRRKAMDSWWPAHAKPFSTLAAASAK